MRRVLHVMGRLERSGMEVMFMSSYEEWRRQGYECDIVGTSRTQGAIASEIRGFGYGVYHIPFRSSWRYLPRARFIIDFYRLCKFGYDVVHLHTEAGRPVYAILAKLAGVRQIAVTPHGIFKFRGLLYFRKLCERQLIRCLGGRFGMISEAVKACEWEQFKIRGFRIRNWLNISHFRPPSRNERAAARLALGVREEDFVIASVGNCSRTKNHPALLRAIALLPAGTSPIYLHVGQEEPACAERELATALNIEGRVRFLGSQADPRPFLWAADAFAMPSLSEGFSISALEAIASGVPLVCSKVEGLSDTAAETKWAVLTSTTPESIAEGLSRVASMEPSLRTQRALSDSQAIRERFSPENGVMSVIDNLYSIRDETLYRENRLTGPREQLT